MKSNPYHASLFFPFEERDVETLIHFFNILHEATLVEISLMLMFSALLHFNCLAFIPVNIECQDMHLLFTHSNHLNDVVIHKAFQLSFSLIQI